MRPGDEHIVRNLRYRWPDQLAKFSDEQLASFYDEFSMSDMHGNNDEQFLEFLGNTTI